MKFDTGLSGCKIELIDNCIIRKYSSSVAYNQRLACQFDKQFVFSQLDHKCIQTPTIISARCHNDDLYYFEMEYVPGLTFDEFFSVCSLKDVEFVIESLFEYFDNLIQHSRIYSEHVILERIKLKIASLMEKSQYPKFLQYIGFNLVESFELFSNIPNTFCHGDLTFANIVFHKKRLYFVDFLDSFVDSFLIDLVKLKQDLYHLWSLKIQGINSLRIRQIYRYIWRRLEEKYQEHLDSNAFSLLEALNVLRIEPYLTNDYQRAVLDSFIKSTGLYEDFSCTNGWKI